MWNSCRVTPTSIPRGPRGLVEVDDMSLIQADYRSNGGYDVRNRGGCFCIEPVSAQPVSEALLGGPRVWARP